MFDQYLQQLASQDATVRRQAIIALGNSGDPQALPALANVYKNDSDPLLRELALKAGRYIKRQTLTAPGAQPVPTVTVTPTATPTPPTPSTPPFTLSTPATDSMAIVPAESRAVAAITPLSSLETLDSLPSLVPAGRAGQPSTAKEISDHHKRLGQGKLDSAIGMVSRGENAKGLAELMDALRHDPAIAKNTIAMNLAATITGISSPDVAMQDILRRMKESGGKVPGKSVDLGAMLASTDLLETLLMVVLLFLVMCGLGFGLKFMAQNLSQAIAKLNTRSTANQTANQAVLAATASTKPSDIIAHGAALTFGALVDTIVLYLLGLFLGGAGRLFQFLKAFLRIQIVMYLLIALAFGLMIYSINLLSASHDSLGATIMIAALVLLVLSFLGGMVWQLLAMMRQHEVGFLKAFMIVVVGVGVVVIGIVNAFIP